MTALIQKLLLPPGLLLLIGVCGLLLWRRPLGRWLVGTMLLLLWVLSTPLPSWPLVRAVQWQPPLTASAAQAADAQAIVVLGGGRKLYTADYGDTVNHWTLLRLRYAARVHRWTGLPIVPVGGAPDGKGIPEGVLMQGILEQEFQVPVLANEHESRNTYENGMFAARLLEPQGIRRVILVTQAVHMPRAVRVFEHAGFDVVPAPTDYTAPSISVYAFTPQADTFYDSYLALHEILGGWWYRIRYGV
jgi:uncharacterized SAM-binding protein YcdF (DUF218 family)